MDLPDWINTLITQFAESADLNRGLAAMQARENEFSSPEAAVLAGIGVDPKARARFNEALDRYWAAGGDDVSVGEPIGELVIGAGYNAAIYCSQRVAQGYERPVVLEQTTKVGGAFACSQDASFYLNSRNRPGPLSIPGEAGALNVLPGAPVQPADLSPAEYQRNNDLAYAIRCALAVNARVITECRVAAIETLGDEFGPYNVRLASGVEVGPVGRIIDATGLGAYRLPFFDRETDRLLSFPRFMGMMDRIFPLIGMKRVAVVGAGDSGRCAVEALLGQGPAEHFSVPSLDFPEQIDWYGCDQFFTGEQFLQCNRSRYQGIARFLPREGDTRARVLPRNERGVVELTFDAAVVNERRYDLVVYCGGLERVSIEPDEPLEQYFVGGRPVAVQGTNLRELYRVGPAAGLPLSPAEIDAYGRVPENETAIFRYATKTATLARDLPVMPVREPGTPVVDLDALNALPDGDAALFIPFTTTTSNGGYTRAVEPLTVDLDALNALPDFLPAAVVRGVPEPLEPLIVDLDLSEIAGVDDNVPLLNLARP